jgi:hypothetical protein
MSYAVRRRRREYAQRVLHTRPGNLLAYWPLDEASGAIAHDLSGNGFHGAYTGVDLAQPGIGDGRTSPYFDGINDFVNIYTAGLANVFSGARGTLVIWAKIESAGVWADGVLRNMVHIAVDGTSNILGIRKATLVNYISIPYFAGGTDDTQSYSISPVPAWLMYGVTWDAGNDILRGFIRGVEILPSGSTLGVWTGSLAPNRCVIGARTNTATDPWFGYLAHCALWNCALTPREMGILGSQP